MCVRPWFNPAEFFYSLSHSLSVWVVCISLYLCVSVTCHTRLPFDLFSVSCFKNNVFSLTATSPVPPHVSCLTCVSVQPACALMNHCDTVLDTHIHKPLSTVMTWQRQNPCSYSLIILVRWAKHRQVGQTQHTYTRSDCGPTPSGHILITRHSCPHLRNWSCDGVRVARATAIAGETYFQHRCCQPRGLAGALRGVYPAARS